MRCTHCIVYFENGVAGIVLLMLSRHYWNPIVSLRLKALSLILIVSMRSRTVIELLVVNIIRHMRGLLPVWFHSHNRIKSCDVTPLGYIFVSSKLLFWTFTSWLRVDLRIRPAWRVVYVASSVNILQLCIWSQLLNWVWVIRMSRASILEMQNVGTALLIYDNTWIIIFTHYYFILRL